MIKKLVIIMNIVCILLPLNGMDDIEKDEKIEIPNLNLDNLPNNGLISSNGVPKTPINNTGEITNLLRARSTLLQKTPKVTTTPVSLPSKGGPGINPDNISINDTAGLEESKGLRQRKFNNDISGLEELQESSQHKFNLEEAQKWELLKKFNGTIYEFAQAHSMSFDEATIYNDLLQQFHLAPEAVVEFVKQTNKLGNHKADDWEIKHYQDLHRKAPTKYEGVMLDVMKEMFDKEDGKTQRSTVHSEHLAAQNNQIVGQKGFIQKLTVGNVVTTISTIVMAIWAVYGQVSSSFPANQHNGTA